MSVRTFGKYITYWMALQGKQLFPGGINAFHSMDDRNPLYPTLKAQPGFSEATFACECFFHHCGRPYYKIDPDLLDAFLSAPLDIPGTMLTSPHAAFEIRLPLDGTPVRLDVRGVLRRVSAILVWDSSVDIPGWPQSQFKVDSRHGLIVCLQLDEAGEFYLFHMNVDPMLTIEQVCNVADSELGAPGKVDRWPTGERVRYQATDDGRRDVLKIVASVCLLAIAASRFLGRDVLARDRALYYDLPRSDPQRKAIEERAARAGVFGWIITTEWERVRLGLGRDLVVDKPFDGRSAASRIADPARQLRYTHIRGAHWHRYPSAKNPVDQIQFLLPCLVRPDLPEKPEDPEETG